MKFKWTKLKIIAIVLFVIGKIILLGSLSLITGFAINESENLVSWRIIGVVLIILGLGMFIAKSKD